MRSYSLRKKGFGAFLLMSSVVIGLFLLCSIYMIRSYQKDFIATNQLVVDHYARQMNKDMEMLCNYVDRFSVENMHLQRLQQKNLSEFNRVGEEYYLKNALENKAASLDFPAILFYYDEQTEKLRSVYSETDTTTGQAYFLSQELKAYLKDLSKETTQDRLLSLQGKNYALHIFGVKGKYVGFLLNLNQYFQLTTESAEGEMQLIFTDKDGNRITECGASLLSDTLNANTSHYITVAADLNMLDMQLRMVRPFWKLQEMWKNKALWLFVILIPLIVMVFFRLIYGWFNRMMLEPVEYLLYRIDQMEEKEQSVQQPEEKDYEPIQEFREVHIKLDNMLEKMKRLQYEKYQKELEAQDAQLQYYKLQINPHFFLNCMNLLDSLLGKQDVTTMRTFLYSLSHHFRYIFKNQADLVSLKEELEEVQAYVNLYIIKGQEPILLQTDVKAVSEDIRIPILTVQTFVENSIKYAKEPGKILALKVSVNQRQDEEGEFLCIKISDNGKGYSEEMLKELNKPYAGFACHSNHVGIDNIKYRIHHFCGEKADIVFYNDTMGGAITEILLPREGQNHENSDY